MGTLALQTCRKALHRPLPVDVPLLAQRSIDQNQRRTGVGGSLDGVKVKGFLGHGGDSGSDHREVLRKASGHDRIDGDFLLDKEWTL